MTDPHVSLDELADAAESLPDPDRAEQVRRHVQDCPQCQARRATLERVRSVLHSAPRLTMPADVAYQLDQSIQPATAAEPTSTSPRTVVPLSPRAARRRGPAIAAVAAGVVVVGLAAALVVGHSRHDSTSEGATSSAASSGGTATGTTPGEPSHYVVRDTGTTYTAASLPTGVRALLNGTAATAAPAPTAASSAGKGGRGHALARSDSATLAHLASSPRALQTCIDSVAGPDSRPVAVDFARWTNGPYHAAPSLVIVVATKPGTDVAYVTGPTCQGLDAVRDYVEVHSTG